MIGRGTNLETVVENLIFTTGVGTTDLMFPPGVGLKLPAGTLVGIQLHTFNSTDQPLSGTSGAEFLDVAPDSITAEADAMLAGGATILLPPGETTTATGTCTITAPQTVFAVAPHMHTYGVHLKTTATIGGVERVLHDAPYDFEHQPIIPIEPIELAPGDTIQTECTWTNTSTETVVHGSSSTEEMCLTSLFRYPALGISDCDE